MEHYCNSVSTTEGAAKNLAIQDTESLASSQDKPASGIKAALPFSPELAASSWFIDASAKREGKVWRCRASALDISSAKGKAALRLGSSQLFGVFSDARHRTFLLSAFTPTLMQRTKVVPEWLPFWQQNDWEVHRTPLWQKEKWQEISDIASQGNVAVGWVASHQTDENPAGEWNN